MGEEEIMDIEGVNAQLASDALAEAAGLEVEIVDDNHFLCKDGETLETLMELSDFEFSEKEQDEMRSVKKIYFYSKPRPAKATSVGKKGSEDPNIFQAADHINYRYEIMTQLGSGAFGTVFCCLDHKYNSAVAIKVLSSKRSVPGDHEVKALEMLTQLKESGHDKKYKLRCLPMLDSFLFQGHACLVFPVGGQNLFQFLSERRFKGLSMEFIRRIAKQLLEFLYHLRMLGIVHCDLKPENILIQNPLSGQIAVIDFGCAHFLDSPSSEKVIYIQSRMFRAPEVMMRLDYGSEIDLWSMGAILIEARGGKVAFPGADCLDMMQRFAEVLGPPPEYLIQQCKRIDSDLADFYFENMHVKGMAVDLMPVKEEKPPSIRRGSLGAYESADDMGASNSNTALTSTKDLSNVSLDSNGAMPSSLHQTSGNGDVGGGAENSINCVGASRIPSQMHIRRDSGSRHLRIPGGKKIGNLFNAKSKDESFLSFVEMLLRWDPAMRPAPESALEHPWINAAPGPSEI
jgi:serine/threonine protein kinase